MLDLRLDPEDTNNIDLDHRDMHYRELSLGLGLQTYNEISGRGVVTDGPVGYCQNCLRDFGYGHNCCQC